jgi:hypothetical protein
VTFVGSISRSFFNPKRRPCDNQQQICQFPLP